MFVVLVIGCLATATLHKTKVGRYGIGKLKLPVFTLVYNYK